MASPRLTKHARDRCKEMGLRIADVRDVVRNPTLVRTSREGVLISSSTQHPTFVVVHTADDPAVIVSVVWKSYAFYNRKNYKPRKAYRADRVAKEASCDERTPGSDCEL